ncbi:MAG: hypothetical protein ACKPKO_36000, partial [Candidatus Fonsibacter sp.]
MEVFSGVFSQLQSGISARKIELGGTGDRLKNTRFCVMEAKQERDRDFHDKCCHHGVASRRQAWQMFATCARKLEVRRGTLGLLRDYGSPTAENVVKKATEQTYTQFCTHMLGKPEP